MSKLKSVWGWIIAAVGGTIGFLLYFLTLKNKQINKLKAKVELTETEKEADLLETEIKETRSAKKMLKKEEIEIDKILISLDEKRKTITKEIKNKSDKEIEEYWNS